MFRLSRRRRQVGETGNPRSHHPSGEQAYAALSEGRCLYALVSGCSGPPLAVDFGRDGASDVLVCKAHVGRLRQLDAQAADELESYLRSAFGKPPLAQEDEPLVWRLRR
jgi:hypothetical protein